MEEGAAGSARMPSEAYPLINPAHPCWPVITYGIIITILTICGILLNFAVILVTIRTKSLRGSVNILLAFYSLCEIVNLSGNFLSIFTAFSGQYFMPFKRAVYFVIVPFEGIGCAVNLMLFIGIERLFIVIFPLKNFNSKIFLVIVFKFNLIFVISTSVIISCFAEKSDSLEIFANSYEIWPMIGKSSKLFNFGSIIIMLILIVYMLIAVALYCRKVPSNGNSDQLKKRLFQSLFAIFFVNFGGYLILFLVLSIISPMLHDNAMALWHTNQIVGILVHISASSNGPILYFTSSEYRNAFQKTFAILFKALCKSSAVVPQPLFTRNVLLMKNVVQPNV